jgi:hypothetical protein
MRLMDRRAALLLVAIAGCYSPTIAEGIPCGEDMACPSALICDPQTSRCVRELSPAADAARLDASADAMLDAASTDFVDTFSRPDGPAIGNGWIEKVAAVYALAGGEVTRVDTVDTSYRDNIVYRPASENQRDVEVSIRVRFLQTPPRYAQIFARARTATIGTLDAYDGYLLYVDGETTNEVVLGRQVGNVFVVTLERIVLAEPFDVGSTYRLTLRVQGADPVALGATIEKRQNNVWVTIGSATAIDTAANRIVEPGTVGFGGDEIAAYVYDELRRASL